MYIKYLGIPLCYNAPTLLDPDESCYRAMGFSYTRAFKTNVVYQRKIERILDGVINVFVAYTFNSVGLIVCFLQHKNHQSYFQFLIIHPLQRVNTISRKVSPNFLPIHVAFQKTKGPHRIIIQISSSPAM